LHPTFADGGALGFERDKLFGYLDVLLLALFALGAGGGDLVLERVDAQ